MLTSTISGEGIDDLRKALKGRISVMVGKSGVGKTALLNALQPGLGLRVKEVNQVTGKGRHTTTNLEMFPLEGGGAIVDTPGTREFGLWDNRGSTWRCFSLRCARWWESAASDWTASTTKSRAAPSARQ